MLKLPSFVCFVWVLSFVTCSLGQPEIPNHPTRGAGGSFSLPLKRSGISEGPTLRDPSIKWPTDFYNSVTKKRQIYAVFDDYYAMLLTTVIAVGSPGQFLWVVLDTGSCDTWVLSAVLCANPNLANTSSCLGRAMYNNSLSSSYIGLGTNMSLFYNGGEWVMGMQDKDIFWEAPVCAQNFTFAEAYETNPTTYGTSGTLSLAFSGISMSVPPQQNLIWAQYLQGFISYPLFSIFINPNYGGSCSGGVLQVNGVNSSFYLGNVTYVPINMGMSGTAQFWNITLGSVQLATHTPLCNTSFAIVDTGTSWIGVPPAIWPTMIQQINASGALLPSSSGISSYTVNCSNTSSLPNLKFTIGGKVMHLNGLMYTINIGGICYLGLFSYSFGSPSVWILGDIFLMYYYTIYDMFLQEIGFAQASNAFCALG